MNAWHKKWSGLQMKWNVFNEKKKPEKIFTQSRLDLLRLEGTWFEKLSSNATIYYDTWYEWFLLTSEDETWR